jgi:hypothetical protein
MKSERTVVLTVIALLLLVLFAYDRLNHMEENLTRQRISGLNERLDSLIGTARVSDARYRSYIDDLRQIQQWVGLVESEKRALWTKLDLMSAELKNLRSSLSAANLDNSKQVIELGAISVKKNEKTRK